MNIKFDPSKANYALRTTYSVYTRKDGTKTKSVCGPYWHANVLENGRIRTYYLGKSVPEECLPYMPKEYIKGKAGRPKNVVRGATDTIEEALARGEQVVIDLNKIAKDCDAYVDKIGDKKYVIYRDPK